MIIFVSVSLFESDDLKKKYIHTSLDLSHESKYMMVDHYSKWLQSHSQLAVEERGQPGLQSKIIYQKTKRKLILNVSDKTANCYVKTVVGTIEDLAQW